MMGKVVLETERKERPLQYRLVGLTYGSSLEYGLEGWTGIEEDRSELNPGRTPAWHRE